MRPDPGYEVKLDDEQMAELAVWRRNRDLAKGNGANGSPDSAAEGSYFDPQLKKAIEYIQDQLQKQKSKDKPSNAKPSPPAKAAEE